MTEFVGRGDPRRSMSLLWGLADVPTRGPKQALSIDDIARAAIEIADELGLEAVTMRKVGERFGKSPMALYTYVPGKAELLDLMLDTVLGELPTRYERVDGWRAAAEASAHAGWAFYERHPWVLQISGARALLGPNELAAYESQLAVFDDLGLTGVEMTHAVGVVSSYVRGAAKAVSDARTAEQVTGLSDDEWWNARAPLLEELAGDDWNERYPTLVKLDAEQAFAQTDRAEGDATPYMERDALDTFAFGLQRLLDGLEVFIHARTAKPGPKKKRPPRR